MNVRRILKDRLVPLVHDMFLSLVEVKRFAFSKEDILTSYSQKSTGVNIKMNDGHLNSILLSCFSFRFTELCMLAQGDTVMAYWDTGIEQRHR